jgi:hypothetical protein
LKEVYLQFEKRSANPICNNSRYPRFILSKVEKLEILDGAPLKKNLHGLFDQ